MAKKCGHEVSFLLFLFHHPPTLLSLALSLASVEFVHFVVTPTLSNALPRSD